jgi:hypothetical protein
MKLYGRGRGSAAVLNDLRFEVSYLDSSTNTRQIYGRANDRAGADALVASIKAQGRAHMRDPQIHDRRAGKIEEDFL